MLKITYKNKEYQFEIEEASKPLSYVYGKIDLDNNWRELDYKNGGHTLGLGATTCFEVPRTLFKELSRNDFFYSDQIDDEVEDGIICEILPTINFDLTINYSNIFNYKTYETVLIGNIQTHFPDFRTLENLNLDTKIIENSELQLYNGLLYDPILTAIKFGAIKENKMHLTCSAYFITNEEKGNVEIDVWLPIKFYFEAGVYSDSFPDKTIQERFKEIKDCFSSIYDISEYNLKEKIMDKKSKRVQIQFEYK
ncbi:hypothetical protein [Maribacter sp.]|uniref:hypothetical protein n=1 Tax=Maribacter sp. TaxID=1897614 RepID=UPI0025BB04BF|nr:hypothetical protein [Maribacter sp.]